jgi:DNA-binding protein H-NS
MKKLDLKAMPLESLWKLYEDARTFLTKRMNEQKEEIEHRLLLLKTDAPSKLKSAKVTVATPSHNGRPSKPRAQYPKVWPQFRNPAAQHETWSGRGHRPRWLVAQISAGRNVEEFRIRSQPTSHQTQKTKRKA